MKRSIIYVALGLSTLTMACGPSEKEGEGEKVDHVTVQQGLSANTTEISKRIATSGAFLDNVNILNSMMNSDALSLGTTSGTVDCVAPPCEPIEPEPIEVNLGLGEMDQEGEQLAKMIREEVFTQENLESNTAVSLTYLIPGSFFCGEDAECAQVFNDAEIRIRVTSPAAGDYDLDLLIGPGQSNPISGSLHNDLVAAEVDLAGVKSAAEHLESIGAIEGLELPTTMDGRLRAQLAVEGPNRIALSTSVVRAIDVREGFFGIQLAETDPTFKLTLDGDAQTVEGLSNVGTLDIQTVIESEGTQNNLDVHLGGSSATVLLDAAQDIIEITNIGLGDSTTTASVDGNQFLGIDLNANDGRRLDATISVDANDQVEISVSPKFDLSVALQFANAMAIFDTVEDWMMDEVITVTLDGASQPRILGNENGLQVLEGQLTLGLQNAGITHTVSAGQCLLNAPAEGEGDLATNPFEEIAGGACE